ncbi:MAG: hypothetical protein M5U28_29060 [Sandaracinaceae bacterium]|nr:hypothetical protein [Sandaracinaceae bacterium]
MMMLDPDSSVREARDAYLSANGFDTAGYTAPTFALPVFGREVRLPNPPTRQRAMARHDLHHALTGYATDYAGEAEIGAWELRAGCNTVFLWLINLAAVAIGLVIAPRRVARAFRSAAGHRSLYLDPRPVDELLELDLGDLREELGIARAGVAERAPELPRSRPLAA